MDSPGGGKQTKRYAAPQLTVCGRPADRFLDEIERFHGAPAPGVVLGGLMVDLANELLGPGVEADAIVETVYCLPDAVQLFTPCTFGNGWMKVLDWAKFALVLYDRRTRHGHRVWLDLEKAAAFPNLVNWYLKRVSKKDLPLGALLDTIFAARRAVFSSQAVRVTDLFLRRKKGAVAVCPRCGEAYDAAQGTPCSACRGEGYWEALIKPAGAERG